eukprot:GHVS01050447.1.p1 GENE.GHVS01050447.1~~GHVS01050447.1.p1  ORF type:complete len:354 (-),score=100.29 GHVS01050447.1:287-1348(-)
MNGGGGGHGPSRSSSSSSPPSSSQSLLRIHREIREITGDASPFWCAYPLSMEEPYEWHFTLRGPADSDFAGGLYHGRIVLPQSYPFSPPSVMLLTPNGRFEVGKKVCLSATNYHPEMWQPAWGLRTMLDALHAFFPTKSEGALHSLEWPGDVRRKLASDSVRFTCSVCKKSNTALVEEKCSQPTTKRPVLPADIKAVPLPKTSQATSSPPPPSDHDNSSSSSSPPLFTTTNPTSSSTAATASSTSSDDFVPSPVASDSRATSSTSSSAKASSSSSPAPTTAESRRAAVRAVTDRSAAPARADRSFLRQLFRFPDNRIDVMICAADIAIILLLGGVFVLLVDLFLQPPNVLDST